MFVFVVLFFFIFCLLAWKNFRLAVCFLILLLPSYLLRFDLPAGRFGLPTTLLEISFGALFLVWLVKYARGDWVEIKKFVFERKVLSVAIGVFFVASVVSIFVSDMVVASLGQWRAYFLEPMLLFFVLVGRRQEIGLVDLARFLSYSAFSVGLVAIAQKFSSCFYPPSLWDDELGGRATSFFTSPNAVGLYLGPVVMLIVALLVKEIKERRDKKQIALLSLALAVSALAIFFSFSLGAWAALGGGLLIFVCLITDKKKKVVLAVLAAVIILVFFAFGDVTPSKGRSLQNRLILWTYSWQFLSASPKNFILGTGIRQFFRKVQKPHYDAQEMERLIYPHNIALNFWTEIGLAGMLSFFTMFGSVLYILKKRGGVMSAGAMAALAVVLVHGLVDVPYFKNDLAMIFWIILSFVAYADIREGQAAGRGGESGEN